MIKTAKVRFRIYPWFVVPLLVLGCDFVVVENGPHANPYRTEHFVIYYNDALIAPHEIEQIGMKKELLLKLVNEYLGTDFDGTITVFPSDDPSHAANTATYETVFYILFTDEGHEMAHVVVTQEWGLSRSSFLKEGIATACEYNHRAGDALQIYSGMMEQHAFNLDSFAMDLQADIVKDEFKYSGEEYCRAGAFVHYLKQRFGVDLLRTWYQSTIDANGEYYGNTFEETFEVPLDTAIRDFGEVIAGRNP